MSFSQCTYSFGLYKHTYSKEPTATAFPTLPHLTATHPAPDGPSPHWPNPASPPAEAAIKNADPFFTGFMVYPLGSNPPPQKKKNFEMEAASSPSAPGPNLPPSEEQGRACWLAGRQGLYKAWSSGPADLWVWVYIFLRPSDFSSNLTALPLDALCYSCLCALFQVFLHACWWACFYIDTCSSTWLCNCKQNYLCTCQATSSVI